MKQATKFFARWIWDLSAQGVWVYAGNLAFRIVFCLFPALLFVLSAMVALGYVSQTSQLLDESRPFGPVELVDLAQNQLQALDANPRPLFTLSALIATGILFWISSGIFRVLFRFCNNELLQTRDTRHWYHQIPLTILLAALFLIGGVIVISLVTAGPQIVDLLNDWLSRKVPWEVIRWLVVFSSYLGLFYTITILGPSPNKRVLQPKLQVAAILAVCSWLLFSWIFRHYLIQTLKYNETYGAIAGAIIILLYLYYSAMIFLLGLSLHFRLLERKISAQPIVVDCIEDDI